MDSPREEESDEAPQNDQQPSQAGNEDATRETAPTNEDSPQDSTTDHNQRERFNARSHLRKRLRPRNHQPSSSDSDESSSHSDRMEIGNLVDTTDDSSSDDFDADWERLRPKENDPTETAQPDPSLEWIKTLCKPVNTKAFNTLRWQVNRAVGAPPSIADCCRSARMTIQGSPWMVGRWKLSKKLDQHEGCVNAVNFNESGSLIASGSDDLNIIIWDWTRSQVISRYDSGHSANVFQSKFLPFSSDLHVVSCARDGQIRLAQLSTSGECRNTRRLGMHRGSAHKLSLNPACPHSFYSCGEDATVYLFDVREEKPTKLFLTKERHSKIALYSIHANPVSDYEFLTSGRDRFIRTYDRRYCSAPTSSAGGSDRPSKKFCPPHLNSDTGFSKHVTCAVYSNDGQFLIGSYNDDDIYLFATTQQDGEDAIRKFRGHRNYATVKGVNFYGPRSEFVVSGSDCGNVFIWETDTGNVVNMFHGDDGGVVNVLEPHPHDPILATSGLDHDVKIWQPDLECPKMPNDLSEKVGKFARKNAENRKSAISDDDDGPLPSIAWILMEALQRERRRHMRSHMRAGDEEPEEEEEDDDNSDSSEVDSSSESDGDDLDSDDEQERDGSRRRPGGRRPVRIQCAQS